MTTPPAQPNEEISLLDILVVLAENFWLLLLAPLAIGAITFGIVSFLPKTYESTALLRANAATVDGLPMATAELAVKLQSPVLLNQAAGSRKWITDRNLDPQSLEGFLSKIVAVRTDRQSSIITLTTSGPTPEDAQALAESILRLAAEALSVQGAVKERALQRLESARDALNVMNTAFAAILQVDAKTRKVETDFPYQPASRPALADLVEQKLDTEETIRDLELALNTSEDDIIIQRPTFESKAVRPKTLQLIAVSTILSGLALTVLVFIRAALRAAAHDPEGADKITRIRKGILLR
jgi:uncharacterized protein involved in exopolysaccharide biosynthesis